jgi:hypothetical protein
MNEDIANTLKKVAESNDHDEINKLLDNVEQLVLKNLKDRYEAEVALVVEAVKQARAEQQKKAYEQAILEAWEED